MSDKRVLLWLFLGLGSWYLVTAGGHTYSSDEETMLATALQISRGYGVSITADIEETVVLSLIPGTDGYKYGQYPIGPSLLVLPWVACGQYVAQYFQPQYHNYIFHLVCSTFNQLIVPLIAVVIYLFARTLKCTRFRALSLALILGLASPLFPYAQTFFSEPLVALNVLLSAWLIARHHGRRPLLGGTVLAVTVMVKYAAILFYLPLLIYLWHYGRQRPTPLQIRGIIIFLLPLVVSGLLIMGMNYVRFGGVLQTGYQSRGDFKFSPVPGVGFLGLTVSPGKGLLWYWPVIFLVAAALPAAFRAARPECWLAINALLINLIFYSCWFTWAGENSWGPRYMIFMIPLIAARLSCHCENATQYPRFYIVLRQRSPRTLP